MGDDVRKIHDAFDEEGSIGRLGLRPAPDKEIQAALVPAGGDWQCRAEDGAVTRSIFWRGVEVALINPRGDLHDFTEGEVAMGIRATPIMDKALRAIWALTTHNDDPDPTSDAVTLELIGKIARAAIAAVEQPAPRIFEPEEEPDDEDAPPEPDGYSEAEIDRSQALIAAVIGDIPEEDIAF